MTRSRVHQSRRRRRGPSRLLLIAGVAVVAGLVYGGWRVVGGGAEEAAALTEVSAPSDPAAATPREQPGPVRTAPRPVARTEPLAAERSGAERAVEPRPVEPPPVQPRREASVERTPPPEPAGSAGGSSSQVRQLVSMAEEKLSQNDPLGARELLQRALRHPGTAESDRTPIRRKIAQINEDVIFSPKLHPGEERTGSYRVQRGDSLSRIVARQGLDIHLDLLVHVNRLASPDRIREGQTLKVVRGPFHAIVVKSAYRLDLYSGPPDSPEQWRYVRSFPVGLGEHDSTPTGTFVVDVKDKDPAWVNPRTGERFDRNDPENPIGDRWIGLEGIGDSLGHRGYGLHGTIEPESIGLDRPVQIVP